MDAKVVQVFERDVKLYFDEADRRYSSDFATFSFCQQLCRLRVLCRRPLEEAEYTGEDRAAQGAENVNVARMRPRLRWQVCNSIAADHVATQVVSFCEGQLDLRPS